MKEKERSREEGDTVKFVPCGFERRKLVAFWNRGERTVRDKINVALLVNNFLSWFPIGGVASESYSFMIFT